MIMSMNSAQKTITLRIQTLREFLAVETNTVAQYNLRKDLEHAMGQLRAARRNAR